MNQRTPDTNARERHFAQGFANFTVEEMRCKCGECLLPIEDPEFRDWCFQLQALRSDLGFPFHVTSWYRCPDYNDSLYYGNTEHMTGPHTKGATDMLISFERMYKLAALATTMGLGVGIKQHGSIAERFIHLDNLGSRLWTYK